MASSYVVYDQLGQIIRAGICPENMVSIQAKEGESVLPGSGNDLTHKVVDGKIVSKSEKELEEITTAQKISDNEQRLEAKIYVKGLEILRRMAIEELKKEEKNGL